MTNKSNDDQLVLLKRAYAYEKAKDSVDVDESLEVVFQKQNLLILIPSKGMRLWIFRKSVSSDRAIFQDEDSSRLCGIADAFGHFVCGLSYCEPCRKERDDFGDR